MTALEVLMRNKKNRWQMRKLAVVCLMATLMASVLTGCGVTDIKDSLTSTREREQVSSDSNAQGEEASEAHIDEVQQAESSEATTTDEVQSAANGHIDFDTLQAENDEIFAWLKVPGTSIDCPVLQSKESDEYYRTHNEKKELDELGAAYVELPTMIDMCDFNTVIHGGACIPTGAFEELVNFLNPDFFEENTEFYIYLPDNQLTYQVWAAFTRENTSLIREYSFAEAKGDREFLDYVYNERIIGKLIREGWDDVDEYNFLTTLTIDNPKMDSQVVVIGVLSNDAAGTIDRQVIEELDLGPDLMAQ